MTTATPDLPTVLSEAVTLVQDHVRVAVRRAEFRRLLRKAQAEIRSRGREYNHGTVAALRASFPEYAELLPASADIREASVPADDAPVVPPVTTDEDQEEDEEEECEYHDDGSARCTHCDGFPYERCSHDFSCSECGSEDTNICTHCTLAQDCDHEWQCDECDEPVTLSGNVT